MPESTTSQHSTSPVFGTGIGGDGWALGWHGYKTPAGVTIVPPDAATHGSLAFEGRNAYSPVYGVGGWGYPGIHAGTFATYRRMLRHPTIALAVATIVGPIMAAGCSIESDEGADDARELIETTLMPQRNRIVGETSRGVFYGFQAAELVWGQNADGRTILEKWKPLLPDWTTFKSDKQGNLIALMNNGVELSMDRAFVFTHDGEGDNPYGLARLEAIRREWTNYLAKTDQLFRLGGKASGISVHVGYPPDTETAEVLAARGETTNALKAQQMARDLSAGKSIVFPGLAGLRIENIEDAIALSKGTLWPITLLDLGDVAGSQGAMLEDLKYIDQLLCRGLRRSERSVIEATGGGTRAESADHTANISDTDCDMIHEAIVDAINRQIVEPLLVENFGEEARRSVRLRANQIVDEHRAIDGQILAGVIADPLAFGELLSRMDLAAFADRQGIKMREGAQPWPDEMPTGGKEPDPPTGDVKADDNDPAKEAA